MRATTLAVLFLLTTVLPTVMGHQRSYSSAGGDDSPVSNASDGTVNRTATLAKRTAPQTSAVIKVSVRAGSPVPLATASTTGRTGNGSTETTKHTSSSHTPYRNGSNGVKESNGNSITNGGGGGYRRYGAPLHPKTTIVDDLCISCPPERTAIARKGLDGVMIEPPCLSTCNGRPISKELYELETLFGPRTNFILPHSNGPPHSFMAKVVSKQTGSTVLNCDLRYRVIVKQCKRYKPKNRDLRVSCSLENIWGSRCTFHCRSGGYLSRPNSYVECGKNELWEGEEPYCISRATKASETTRCDRSVTNQPRFPTVNVVEDMDKRMLRSTRHRVGSDVFL